MKDSILAHALFLNGSNETEIQLQYKLLLWMLQNLHSGREIDEDEFALAVETAQAVGLFPSSMQKNYCFRPAAFFWMAEIGRFLLNLSCVAGRLRRKI